MIHPWTWVGVGLLLMILSFVMTPPTWIVERLFTRFKLHPKLVDDEIESISRGEERITGTARQQLIEAFNKANYLERHETSLIPSNELPLVFNTHHKGRRERYTIYADPPFIDVVKEFRKKRIIYKVDSKVLMQWLVNKKTESEQ